MTNKAGDEVGAKVEHKNIYEALAAFQGENPKIERTKKVSIEKKAGGTFEFWYAPLDEVLQTVRPLLAKHGLSITHVDAGESAGGNRLMQCVLYHETYGTDLITARSGEVTMHDDHKTIKDVVYENREHGVIRSMPVVVKRSGDMKDVGGESTYARRYTLAEVLGIAADEDNDIAEGQERTKSLESTAMGAARNGILNAKTEAEVAKMVTRFDADLAMIADGKKSTLGFKKEQLDELIKLAAKRMTEIKREGVGKPNAGENHDAKGEGAVEQE